MHFVAAVVYFRGLNRLWFTAHWAPLACRRQTQLQNMWEVIINTNGTLSEIQASLQCGGSWMQFTKKHKFITALCNLVKNNIFVFIMKSDESSNNKYSRTSCNVLILMCSHWLCPAIKQIQTFLSNQITLTQTCYEQYKGCLIYTEIQYRFVYHHRFCCTIYTTVLSF